MLFGSELTGSAVKTVSVGIESNRASDPLGLYTKTLVADREMKIEVTPRAFPIDDSSFRMLELTETTLSTTPFQKDGMDYLGVREYQWGDPP